MFLFHSARGLEFVEDHCDGGKSSDSNANNKRDLNDEGEGRSLHYYGFVLL